MTTNDFADQINILGPSIHRRYCLTGSYYGVTPTKLPNGRLDWPNDAREQLLAVRNGKCVKQGADHTEPSRACNERAKATDPLTREQRPPLDGIGRIGGTP
jgi:hypothetical protein